MKIIIIFLLAYFSTSLLASCHKAVVSIAPLKMIKLYDMVLKDEEESINKVKKEIEETNDPDYRKSLNEELKGWEEEWKNIKETEKKYFKDYPEIRRSLIETYNRGVSDLKSSSLSIEFVPHVDLGGKGGSDYSLLCGYSVLTRPYRGRMTCRLIDVEKGIIVWVKKVLPLYPLGDSSFSSNDIVNAAWEHIKAEFPKASKLENAIRKRLDYKSASLEYKHDDDNKKEANGKETGEITISDIVKKIEWADCKPRNIAEFIFRAKQGKFKKTNQNKLDFIPKEYRKNNINGDLSYKYKTYNCNKASIKDKLFETFTLERSCFLSQDDSTIMAEIKVPFECQEPYYTVTVTQKTTSKVKPLAQYRGISQTLKSFEEDKDVYYIYVDVDKAKIEQYHVNKLSTRKIHKEAYELNTKSCKYEVKSEDKVVKNMGGPYIFKSEDAGWGFEDNTMIYVTPPYSDKQLSFTWGRLRENGSYHASGKYKKEIPKLVKELMGKVNGMATAHRNESQTDPIMQFFISTTYLTAPDEGCAGRVSMESFIPPLDGYIDPDVEYKINIRPSTKKERKVMKRFLNNEVGNPGDYILKALQQVGGGVDGK